MLAKEQLQQLMSYHLTKSVVDETIAHILNNDPAHDIHHVLAVVKTAEVIMTHYSQTELTESERSAVLIAAFMHDIGSGIDRKNHHSVGASLTVTLLTLHTDFSRDYIYRIANAVYTHRASFKGDRFDPIADVVALADRGMMNQPEAMLVRACMTKPESTDSLIPWSAFNSSWEHGIEKFGPNGYAWDTYPEMGKVIFSENIEKLKRTFSKDNRPVAFSQYMTYGLMDYSGNLWKYDKIAGDFVLSGTVPENDKSWRA